MHSRSIVPVVASPTRSHSPPSQRRHHSPSATSRQSLSPDSSSSEDEDDDDSLKPRGRLNRFAGLNRRIWVTRVNVCVHVICLRQAKYFCYLKAPANCTCTSHVYMGVVLSLSCLTVTYFHGSSCKRRGR